MTQYLVTSDAIYLANIFQGRIEYELIYSLRGAKKSVDQRAPQIGYEGIKSLRSLAMKNYLVTRGLLSLVESYNNKNYIAYVVPFKLNSSD